LFSPSPPIWQRRIRRRHRSRRPRIVPIIGGDVRGDHINGKVCAFGADFQIIRPNELIELEAKYAFETDDGAVIYVENRGIRFGPVELLQRLKRGEAVDPALIYFPHRAEVRDRQRKIPLADGIPVLSAQQRVMPTAS